MTSSVGFLSNLRQDRWQRSEMFSWNKIINALKRSKGNINPFTTFKPLGWKCYKTIGSYVSCAFIEIWSTWEVWRALKKLELLSATPRATLTHLSCSPNFPRASYLDERTMKKWYTITDFRGMRISQMKQTPKHFRTSLQNQNEDWFSWFGLIFLSCFFRRPTIEGPFLSTCRVWRS